MQKLVFQLEHCVDPKFCSFHEEYHPEKSCLDWQRVISSICNHTLDVEGDM